MMYGIREPKPNLGSDCPFPLEVADVKGWLLHGPFLVKDMKLHTRAPSSCHKISSQRFPPEGAVVGFWG